MDEEAAVLMVPLDQETAMRLMRLARICEADMGLLASSLLRDLLEDDEIAHRMVN